MMMQYSVGLLSSQTSSIPDDISDASDAEPAICPSRLHSALFGLSESDIDGWSPSNVGDDGLAALAGT